MSTTAGALTQLKVTSTTASLSSAVATGGTGPYSYQWYRSTTTGFTPGSGNILAGKTALTLEDTGLTPNTTYYYKVVATDAGSVTGESSQLPVLTSPQSLSQNQFDQVPLVGTLDLRYNFNTKSAEIHSSQATPLYNGMAVKIVDEAGGVPKVVGCSANTDEVFGFINYDNKSRSFNAGDRVEISQAGNVMFLVATVSGARGVQAQLDLSTGGGVAPNAADGADIVGYFYDKPVAGQLCRVELSVPSFLKS